MSKSEAPESTLEAICCMGVRQHSLTQFDRKRGHLIRTSFIPDADPVAANGLTIHINKWFLGAEFLRALPTS